MEEANLGVHLHGQMHADVFSHRQKGRFNVSCVSDITVDYFLQNSVSKFCSEKSLGFCKGEAVHGYSMGFFWKHG